MSSLIKIAVSLAIAAVASHNLPQILFQVRKAQFQLIQDSKASKWLKAMDAIIITAAMACTKEVRTLGRTLQGWKKEICNYFDQRITNARLEGFNRKASLVRMQAYGYKNVNNYRLQLLSACS